MKTKIFMYLVCALLIACTSVNNIVGNPPQQIKLFLNRVIENPELVLDLKKNFPEYINDTLYDDSIYNQHNINNFVRVCKKYFNDPIYSEYFGCFSALEDPYFLSNYKKEAKIYNFKKKNILSTQIVKLNKGSLGFTWIRIDSTYYLYDFSGSGK